MLTPEEIEAHPYREAFYHASQAWQDPATLALHGIEEPIPLAEISTFIADQTIKENSKYPPRVHTAAMAMKGFIAGYLYAKEQKGGDE